MTRTAQLPAEGSQPPGEGRRRQAARWERVGPLVMLMAVAALVAACAGGGSHAAAPPSQSGTPTQNGSSTSPSAVQDGILLVSCIRAHGVPDLPDSAVSTATGQVELHVPAYLKSEARFQSALQACQKYLPGGGTAAKQQRPSIQQEVNYAHCMRSHGITNFPDPLPGGGFNITGNTNSQQFQAADKACQPMLGSAGSSGS